MFFRYTIRNHRSRLGSPFAALRSRERRFLGLLLAFAIVASGLLATAAGAAPLLAPVSVTSVGISPTGVGGPVVPPVTVNPGGQFKAWFTFRNEVLLVPEDVIADIVIIDPNGTLVNDAMLHLYAPTCTVPGATLQAVPPPIHTEPGTITCSRTFTVPSNVVGGAYTVRLSAQQFGAAPTPFNYSEDKTGWLIVNGPRLCVSPTSLDFADTGTSANLSITNCGTAGTTLTWSAASTQPWLGIGLPSGTGNAIVPVTVNRGALSVGANAANINMTSNGGSQTIAVSALGIAGPTSTPTATPSTSPTPTATSIASPSPTSPAPPSSGPGVFYSQTNFWIRDGVPCPDNPAVVANFFAEFTRLGAIPTLGYPASRPYWKDGFCYQVFQRGILQWRPDYSPPQAVLANTMDWLNEAGKDDILFARGVPRHFTGDDGAGGDFERAKEIRFGWMTDQAIRDTYFANPSPSQIPDEIWDPVTFYGLPTSQPQDFGAFTTQRFQRYVFQRWQQAVPGMPPPGSVVGVLAGDLAKELGLVPTAAMQIEAP